MTQKRRNKLEAAANRLGLNMTFERRYNAGLERVEWAIISKDGYQSEDWLGGNINDALVVFESRYDRNSYV